MHPCIDIYLDLFSRTFYLTFTKGRWKLANIQKDELACHARQAGSFFTVVIDIMGCVR